MKKRDQKKRNDELIHKIVKKYGGDILESKKFNRSKNFIQHGRQSVFQHSIDVAKMSIYISRHLPFQFKEREIVRGALLHDYFLYDWHKRKSRVRKPSDIKKLHGFTHPQRAMRNADRDFGLSEGEKEIIKKHMWPLTYCPPTNREAWVVTMADKICSMRETVLRKK